MHNSLKELTCRLSKNDKALVWAKKNALGKTKYCSWVPKAKGHK
jgi:hypothetical protein